MRDAAQQREAIGADRRIVGHHEDIVEEAVDDRPCGSQRQQRAGKIAVGVTFLDRGCELLEHDVKIVLGALRETGAVDRDGSIGTGFLQDVDDALIGRRQRLGFGQ